jgi:uncharacterized protein YodC (DUF2158 family)
MHPGDVVQLKSGGPVMTVESVEPSGVICTWFDAKNNHQQRRFLEVTLEKYDPTL